MPGVKKLLISCCIVILMIHITSCKQNTTVVPGSIDVASGPVGSMLSENRRKRETIALITPEFRERILEKQQRNKDTVGWLYIPDTSVDQVVLKTPVNQTNEYYLGIDFEGRPDRDGTFCTDRRAVFGTGYRDELSRNITIYGHSWDDDPDGKLFSQLKRFRDADFAREHPYIFFSTEAEDMVWEVFAVFEAPTDLVYNYPDLPENYFYDILDIIDAASLYSYDIAISPEDKILTLSTCIYSVQGHEQLPEINEYRFVVMARLASPEEAIKQEAVFAVNTEPISPDEILHLIDNGAIREYTHGAQTA